MAKRTTNEGMRIVSVACYAHPLKTIDVSNVLEFGAKVALSRSTIVTLEMFSW